MRHSSLLAELLALTRLSSRYLGSVSPVIRRELARWERHARAIEDPDYRRLALQKLRDTASHPWLNATFTTLAPRQHRGNAVVAVVALEVLYDLLDGLTEQAQSLAEVSTVSEALVIPFQAEHAADNAARGKHGDYVNALTSVCGAALRPLPSYAALAPTAAAAAARCAETQARSHVSGRESFERWASAQPLPAGLEWWEAAAGWTGGAIALNALIALAAEDHVTTDAGNRLIAAYEYVCALATLLDHVIDQREDQLSQGHSYVGYYSSEAVAAERIATVAYSARAAATMLPDGSHHALTVAGIAAYYASAPEAAGAHIAIEPTLDELRPLVDMLQLVFRLLRRSTRSRFPPVAPNIHAPPA